MSGELSVGVGLYTGQRPDGATTPSYADAPRLARAAETAGFDAFWVSEHHGWHDDYLPAPLVVLAAVASVTERILLGTGVLLAPLRHPVSLAEQSAVVDHLSDGRLVLGLGLGYVDDEFRMYGVDRQGRGRRVEDTVACLRSAWRGEPASWWDTGGQRHEARVTPAAVRGDIPVWLGGYADAAIDRAARIADGYLMGRMSADALRALSTALERHGRLEDRAFNVAVNLLTAADEDASARRGFARQQVAYEQRQRHDDPFAGRVAVTGAPNELARGSIDEYLDVTGSVDNMAERILEVVAPLRGHAHVHVVLRALFPEVDTDAQSERLAELGNRVLPELRARWVERRTE